MVSLQVRPLQARVTTETNLAKWVVQIEWDKRIDNCIIETITSQFCGFFAKATHPLTMGSAVLKQTAVPDERNVGAASRRCFVASEPHVMDAGVMMTSQGKRNFLLTLKLPQDGLAPFFRGSHVHIEYVLVLAMRFLQLHPLPHHSPVFRLRLPVRLVQQESYEQGISLDADGPIPINLESEVVSTVFQESEVCSANGISEWYEEGDVALTWAEIDEALDSIETNEVNEYCENESVVAYTYQVLLDGLALATVHLTAELLRMGKPVAGTVLFEASAPQPCQRMEVALVLVERVECNNIPSEACNLHALHFIAQAHHQAVCTDSGGYLKSCTFNFLLPIHLPPTTAIASELYLEWVLRFMFYTSSSGPTEWMLPLKVHPAVTLATFLPCPPTNILVINEKSLEFN